MFDPNKWRFEPHEFRIYGDDRAQTYAIVDEEDYHWLIRWRWCIKETKGKLYLRRAISTYCDKTRARVGSATIYLHTAIMEKSGKERPSPAHMLVDHKDGNSLNCLRKNLRWATKQQNNQNRFGSYHLQQALHV